MAQLALTPQVFPTTVVTPSYANLRNDFTLLMEPMPQHQYHSIETQTEQ
jgi:hypothetical protein